MMAPGCHRICLYHFPHPAPGIGAPILAPRYHIQYPYLYWHQGVGFDTHLWGISSSTRPFLAPGSGLEEVPSYCSSTSDIRSCSFSPPARVFSMEQMVRENCEREHSRG